MKVPPNNGYVVIPQLPANQQAPFQKWLIGQTVPYIESEGENADLCAWYSDYSRWYDYWQYGDTAPNID